MGETMKKDFFGYILAGILAGFLVGGTTTHIWEAETIARGLAMYCPTNGVWAWNGECK
jgi:hypothetical protein